MSPLPRGSWGRGSRNGVEQGANGCEPAASATARPLGVIPEGDGSGASLNTYALVHLAWFRHTDGSIALNYVGGTGRVFAGCHT